MIVLFARADEFGPSKVFLSVRKTSKYSEYSDSTLSICHLFCHLSIKLTDSNDSQQIKD